MIQLKLKLLLIGMLILTGHETTLHAQAQPEPQQNWTTNFGAGIALTSGNTDTKNFNISFGLVHDPKQRNIVRFAGLYLRGDKDGESIVDRTAITFRNEYAISPRVFLFGQNDYIRDTFKEIDYLVSPTAGLGYKLVNTDATLVAVDSSLGGVWEKNTTTDVDLSGALNAGQRFAWKVSPQATITQSVIGLWKLDDFADALYNFGIGIAASITANSELKFEVLDSFKNRPPTVGLQKNDVAVVTTFVLKF